MQSPKHFSEPATLEKEIHDMATRIEKISLSAGFELPDGWVRPNIPSVEEYGKAVEKFKSGYSEKHWEAVANLAKAIENAKVPTEKSVASPSPDLTVLEKMDWAIFLLEKGTFDGAYTKTEIDEIIHLLGLDLEISEDSYHEGELVMADDETFGLLCDNIAKLDDLRANKLLSEKQLAIYLIEKAYGGLAAEMTDNEMVKLSEILGVAVTNEWLDKAISVKSEEYGVLRAEQRILETSLLYSTEQGRLILLIKRALNRDGKQSPLTYDETLELADLLGELPTPQFLTAASRFGTEEHTKVELIVYDRLHKKMNGTRMEFQDIELGFGAYRGYSLLD